MIVEVSPSRVVVVTMTCGGRVRVLSEVDTSVTVWVRLSVSSTVVVTVSVSSTVCVGPGVVMMKVRSDVKVTVVGRVCVNVVVINTSEVTVSVLVIVVPD